MPGENNVSRETDEIEDQQPTDQDTPDRETEEHGEDNVSRETDDDDALENEGKSGSHDAEKAEVGKLRREAANYRTRLRESEQRADALARELVAARIRESGRLADPTDLDPDPALLEDGALDAAIDDLIERKPHLKARSFGDVGQHDRAASDGVSLGSLLRNNV